MVLGIRGHNASHPSFWVGCLPTNGTVYTSLYHLKYSVKPFRRILFSDIDLSREFFFRLVLKYLAETMGGYLLQAVGQSRRSHRFRKRTFPTTYMFSEVYGAYQRISGWVINKPSLLGSIGISSPGVRTDVSVWGLDSQISSTIASQKNLE